MKFCVSESLTLLDTALMAFRAGLKPQPPGAAGDRSASVSRKPAHRASVGAVVTSAGPKGRGTTVSPRKVSPRSFASASPRSPSPINYAKRRMTAVTVGTTASPTRPPTEASNTPQSVDSGKSFQGAARLRQFATSSAASSSSKLVPSARSSAIRVVVRTRPLSDQETVAGLEPVVAVAPDGNSLSVACEGQGGRQVTKAFSFPKCLRPDDTQENVFDTCGVKELLDSAINGYVCMCVFVGDMRSVCGVCRCSSLFGESKMRLLPCLMNLLCRVLVRRYAATVLAYGQTGSGKTFTMSGQEPGTGESAFLFVT